MKKIIDGKRYDTETAQELAAWSNDYSCRDFHWCCETLYKTRKGAYFVHGEGGAMSPWSRSCGDNSWSGGEGTDLLTAEDARLWLEEKGLTQALERWFADSIEDA
jgi:hypothetical protein